jgi:hypothetical protein
LIARIYGDLRPMWPYVLVGAVVSVLSGFVMMSTAVLRADQIPWKSLWSFSPPESKGTSGLTSDKPDTTKPIEPNAVSWESQLAASGTESRLGDAINSILEQERGSPLAGIVVISDGRSNAGIDPLMTISEATLQGVPIHTVGMGTAKNPINVRTVDIEAPKRVFPGDRFRLTALLQASGLDGKQITVQLRRRAGGQKNAGMAIEEERTITLESEDTMTSLVFDIQPREIGSWIYEVKALPPEQDSNPLDNALESEVRVVEPK